MAYFPFKEIQTRPEYIEGNLFGATCQSVDSTNILWLRLWLKSRFVIHNSPSP